MALAVQQCNTMKRENGCIIEFGVISLESYDAVNGQETTVILTLNQRVVGSNPTAPSNYINGLALIG